MRKFWSYGPIDESEHYYASRKYLIDAVFTRLTGGNPQKGGNYITVWAPRQCGKSSAMLSIFSRIQTEKQFHIAKVDLEHLKNETGIANVAASIARDIAIDIGIEEPVIETVLSVEQFQEFFTHKFMDKPLILVLDEFDALNETVINTLVGVFRNIYNRRQKELTKPVQERRYLLHGLALVGVRSVLGVENKKGSPFNVQQSLHVTNLTYDEVKSMFQWYEKESGQKVDENVVKQLYYETCGQPGLTGWFGELLTETYNEDKSKPVTMETFEIVYAAASKILPNNNILNIISKANEEPYKDTVLTLFDTGKKIEFNYRDPHLNFLYMNGVIDKEEVSPTKYYVKFSSPFVQKNLFDYFARDIFGEMGQIVEPFESLDDTVTESGLNIRNLAGRYQSYLAKNKKWLLNDVPRRKDLRVYEAVFHFNFYSFVCEFLKPWKSLAVPEFPTGNGKIDLLVTHANRRYGIELKSFSTEREYKDALSQAANYGKQLELAEISLVFFVETIDSKSREKYQKVHKDKETGVTVRPIFVETGN